jgi:hypothetical protein
MVQLPENLEDRWHTSPSDEPFHELDNIIMSPHKAGGLAVDDVERERMLALADLLNAINKIPLSSDRSARGLLI